MYISIDFGNTNTRVASSLDLNSFNNIRKFRTSMNLEEQKSFLNEAIKDVSNNLEVSFIGMGIHGMINKSSKKFVKMPNYSSLDGKKFTELFDNKYDLSRIFVENDATVAGLAEAQNGAGKNYSVVTYLTISTGIGGARIIDKKIDNSGCFEPGHHIIVKDGKLNTNSGIKGDFEVYASGYFFEDNYGVDSEKCEDINLWEEYASYLAIGIHNVINMWSPDIVILGGGLGYNQFDNFYPHLMENLKKTEFVKIPPIVKSKFGDDAGLYGALSLIKRSKSG